MAPNHELAKPAVHVLYAPDVTSKYLLQVQYGIEEEGIPFVSASKAGASALELAWEAAQTSRLSVGIGMDATNLVLHYSKLDQNRPLFQIPVRKGEEMLRLLGANGARLVKKMPLKPVDT